MRKTLLLLLLVVCHLQTICAQEVAGVTPKSGETYYIYNVYSKSYIAFDGDGKMSLKAQGSPVALSLTKESDTSKNDNSEGTYFMTAGNGNKVATTFLGDVTADGKGTYDHWNFTPVDGTSTDQHIYAIGTRIPDASAVAYLYWSNLFDKVIKLYIQPASGFTKGQWLLVSKSDYEKDIITLDETSTSYSQPTMSGNSATVRLKRTFTLNSWNTLCLPFAVDAAQVQSVIGNDTKVAEYTGCTENTLLFTSRNNIEAGKPYLIYPTKAGANGYYEFTDIKSFAKEPTSVSQTPTGNASAVRVDYIGYFYQTTAPKGAYVLRKNEVYHLQSDMPMKGFRAYFQEQGSAESKLNSWSLDGISTGIDEIAGEAQVQKMDVYNLSGQRVASQVTTLDGIAPGVYLVKGKKVIIK